MIKSRPPFRLKDIAFQAGLSLATVDRALHNRGHVHPQTKTRLDKAIAELERQDIGQPHSGPVIAIDVLMIAPDRFSRPVKRAFERALQTLATRNMRARFEIHQDLHVEIIVKRLDAILARGSHGVVLKAPDVPEICAAVNRLAASGIPVMTLVTDITSKGRTTYIGMDNEAAGKTAAFFMGRFAANTPLEVLVSASSRDFLGEEERISGFEQQLENLHPKVKIYKISGAYGKNHETNDAVIKALKTNPNINAVYSVGGGNRAILTAFKALERNCNIFIGHDLDKDNRALLAVGGIDLVLHHNLDHDAINTCQEILRFHKMIPARNSAVKTDILIATGFSV
jgi:LacI family transcriptional regulator